jgi:hypothetical protein
LFYGPWGPHHGVTVPSDLEERIVVLNDPSSIQREILRDFNKKSHRYFSQTQGILSVRVCPLCCRSRQAPGGRLSTRPGPFGSVLPYHCGRDDTREPLPNRSIFTRLGPPVFGQDGPFAATARGGLLAGKAMAVDDLVTDASVTIVRQHHLVNLDLTRRMRTARAVLGTVPLAPSTLTTSSLGTCSRPRGRYLPQNLNRAAAIGGRAHLTDIRRHGPCQGPSLPGHAVSSLPF